MSYTDLGIPASNATFEVRAIDSLPIGRAPASFFMHPVIPGSEDLTGPVFCYYLQHQITGERILFDVGFRLHVNEYAPPVADLFAKKIFIAHHTADVPMRLEEAGITRDSIRKVFWSHTHFDHIGDMSQFPETTELIVGEGVDLSTYPENPNSGLLKSDVTGHKITELSFKDAKLNFGGFPAIDFFGDGSFYLLNVPGHQVGHNVALVRVTPTTFVLLGADTCHHPGQIRPNEHIHRHFPCPGEFVEHSRHHWSKEHFGPETDLSVRKEPMLVLPTGFTTYDDKEVSLQSMRKLQVLDANPDVLVLLTHDTTVRGIIDEFPKSVNAWKEKGWKEHIMWAFADKTNAGFRFSLLPSA